MGKVPRTYIHHEQPRTDARGLKGVYCRKCGREIIRYAVSPISTVTACAICVAKEQGILNPEDHILNQYQISNDMNRIPVPIDDTGYEDGILMLYPEEYAEQTGMLPPAVGGVVGTVKSIFRAFGFFKPKEEILAEEPVSKSVARGKRGGGLYEPKRNK